MTQRDGMGREVGVGFRMGNTYTLILLQCMTVKSESEVAQSCPTLGDPMDHSLPGSSIHGIFQARVLEWGAIAFSEPYNIVLVLPYISMNPPRVPHPEPHSHLPPCTIPPGHPSAPAPSILYRTWTGDSFLLLYYTCFNAIPPNRPTLTLSHRV